MIRASLKSLLARRVRLLLSTFAIVLGVAFVTGILMFSDTLERSFTALFDSTVGDSVVRPDDSEMADGGAVSTQTVPASLRSHCSSSCRGPPGWTAWSAPAASTSSRPSGKVVGGSGPPAFGGNWSDAPAGHGLEGLVILEGHEPHGADEVVLDEDDGREGRLRPRRQGLDHHQRARRWMSTRRWSASPGSGPGAR